VKTRTLAQKLALSGHVRVNREKVSSAHLLLKAGDVLTIAGGSGVRILRVVSAGIRRGPASEARLLYEDLSSRARPLVDAGRTPAKPDDPAGGQRAGSWADDDFSNGEE
jgi:ribosome-associated heat shock protein Hsp15